MDQEPPTADVFLNEQHAGHGANEQHGHHGQHDGCGVGGRRQLPGAQQSAGALLLHVCLLPAGALPSTAFVPRNLAVPAGAQQLAAAVEAELQVVALQLGLLHAHRLVLGAVIAEITEEVVQGAGTHGGLRGDGVIAAVLTDGGFAQAPELLLVAQDAAVRGVAGVAGVRQPDGVVLVLTAAAEQLAEVNGVGHPLSGQEAAAEAPNADVHGAGAGLGCQPGEEDGLFGEGVTVPTLPLISGELQDIDRLAAVCDGHDEAARVQDGVVVGALQHPCPRVPPIIRDVHIRAHHRDGPPDAPVRDDDADGVGFGERHHGHIELLGDAVGRVDVEAALLPAARRRVARGVLGLPQRHPLPTSVEGDDGLDGVIFGQHAGDVDAAQRCDVGEVGLPARCGVEVTFQGLGVHHAAVVRRVDGAIAGVARLIHVHEHQVVVGRQDGVELLVADGGQLCHAPALTLVQRDVDAPRETLLGHDRGEEEAAAQPEGVDLGADDFEGLAEVGGLLQLQEAEVSFAGAVQVCGEEDGVVCTPLGQAHGSVDLLPALPEVLGDPEAVIGAERQQAVGVLGVVGDLCQRVEGQLRLHKVLGKVGRAEDAAAAAPTGDIACQDDLPQIVGADGHAELGADEGVVDEVGDVLEGLPIVLTAVELGLPGDHNDPGHLERGQHEDDPRAIAHPGQGHGAAEVIEDALVRVVAQHGRDAAQPPAALPALLRPSARGRPQSRRQRHRRHRRRQPRRPPPASSVPGRRRV